MTCRTASPTWSWRPTQVSSTWAGSPGVSMTSVERNRALSSVVPTRPASSSTELVVTRVTDPGVDHAPRLHGTREDDPPTQVVLQRRGQGTVKILDLDPSAPVRHGMHPPGRLERAAHTPAGQVEPKLVLVEVGEHLDAGAVLDRAQHLVPVRVDQAQDTIPLHAPWTQGGALVGAMTRALHGRVSDPVHQHSDQPLTRRFPGRFRLAPPVAGSFVQPASLGGV